MENSSKYILRKSIHSFLVNYHYFTSTSSFLALPFSIAILLSQYLFLPSSSSSSSSSSLFPAVFNRLHNLFEAAGLPSSSDFFTILNLKLSQTLTSFIFALPFSFTFLLLSKSSVIQSFNQFPPISSSSPSFSSLFSIFNPLLLTYICNSFLIVSANATAFTFLFLSFNFLQGFGFSSPTSSLLLSAAGAVVYSVILANAIIISNLALVLSGRERSGGFLPFLKACVMIRGRTSTALSIALPVNMAMAGIEALFQYRIVSSYHIGETPSCLTIIEGILIAYMYSNLIVIDTIASCMFLKSCKAICCCIDRDRDEEDEEEWYVYRIEVSGEDKNAEQVSFKVCQEYS
ncbi:uncharacterized protein [Euphorbia lathyris]|uniref:uncharacterized protein n=1 Tax=Euphorbia lathyris TaxID=212925 RepID=UPI0033133748